MLIFSRVRDVPKFPPQERVHKEGPERQRKGKRQDEERKRQRVDNCGRAVTNDRHSTWRNASRCRQGRHREEEEEKDPKAWDKASARRKTRR